MNLHLGALYDRVVVWVMIRLEPSVDGEGKAATIARGSPRECLDAKLRDEVRHPHALYRMRESISR